VDGAGNDAKSFLRKVEMNEVEGARAPTARDVFNVLRTQMPEPAPRDEAMCPLLSFTRRTHVFLVDGSDALPSDFEDPLIIVTNQREEEKDCKPIPGIQSIYNIQSRPESSSAKPPYVWFRDHPCACDSCQARERGTCATAHVSGVWQKKKIRCPTTNAAAPAGPATEPLAGAAAPDGEEDGDGEEEGNSGGEVLFEFEPEINEESGVNLTVEDALVA
jgi:hypothetical protein